MIKQKSDKITEEQKKVMRTQDIGYVEMKRVAESKVYMALYHQISIIISHQLLSQQLNSICHCILMRLNVFGFYTEN